MKYGKVIKRFELDKEGSFMEQEVSYQENKAVGEKSRYEERIRVKNYREAMDKIIEFAQRIENDDSLLDPAWRYEKRKLLKSRGSFDVVLCYTKIKSY